MWAELAGTVRPDLWDTQSSLLATTRIAIVYEMILGGGLPRTALPVLVMISMAMAMLYVWGVPILVRSLEPVRAGTNDSSASRKTN